MLGMALQLLLLLACTDRGGVNRQWEMYFWHLKFKSCPSGMPAAVSIEIRYQKKQASKLPQKIFFSLGMILWLKLAHIQRYTLSVVWGSIISHIIHMGSTCICYVLVAQIHVRIQILSTESTSKVCLCVFLLSFHWASIPVGSDGGGWINIKSK